MSFVPVIEAVTPFVERAAARSVTAGEATLATAALEGARYGNKWLKTIKKYTPKKYRKKLRPQRLFMNPMQTEGEAARFGENPGEGLTKRINSDTVTSNFGNVVYSMPVAHPNRGDQIDQRQRDVILIKGIKFCANFTRQLAGERRAVLANFALVSRKDDVDSSSNLDQRMFRSNDNSRSVDFGDNLLAQRRHCDPLNNDKFHIWTHRRFKLHDQNSNGNGSKMIAAYVPINRQIRFDASNFPTGELTFIYWFGLENTLSTGTVATTPSNYCNTCITSTTYYDEPMPLSQMSYLIKQLKNTRKGRRRYKRKRYSTKYAKR